MFYMNGIELIIKRTFSYEARMVNGYPPNPHLEDGTKCYELASEDGRYCLITDQATLETLPQS